MASGPGEWAAGREQPRGGPPGPMPGAPWTDTQLPPQEGPRLGRAACPAAPPGHPAPGRRCPRRLPAGTRSGTSFAADPRAAPHAQKACPGSPLKHVNPGVAPGGLHRDSPQRTLPQASGVPQTPFNPTPQLLMDPFAPLWPSGGSAQLRAPVPTVHVHSSASHRGPSQHRSHLRLAETPGSTVRPGGEGLG